MSDDVLHSPIPTPATERGSTTRGTTATSAPPPATGGPAGTAQLVLLVAASCMSVLGSVLIAPVLPLMSREFAGTPGAAALVPVVLVAPALMIGLIAPFAGIFADRLNRKRLLLVAMVLYSVFGTAPLYIDSLPGIVATRIGVGVCEAAIMVGATTLIGDYWSGAQRARYLGLQTLVSALSATLFLFVGGVLGTAGWRTPFWLYFIALLLVVPMARLLWEPVKSARTGGERRRLVPVPWGLVAMPLVTSFFGGIIFYSLIVHLSYVLNDVGVTSTALIGTIAAVMSLATAAGAVLFGRLSHHSPRSLVPLEFGLSAIGLLLVFATDSVAVISIGAILTGLGTGAMLPTLLTWSVNRLTIEQRGRGTGLFTGILFIGQFICPLVIAAAIVPLGGYQNALGALGLLSIVFALVAAVALRRSTQPLDATEVV